MVMDPLARATVRSHVHRHRRIKWAQRLALMAVGAGLAAVALEIFLVPNHIIDGGITGISIMLSDWTGWRLGIFLFVLNLPFFVVGYQQIGRSFALSTLFSIALLSVISSLLVPVPGITEDPLLAAVFGGILLGTGVGMILRNGGSSDGLDVVAILINKRVPWSIGQIILFFNVFILGSAGFVYGWDHAMYSLIAYFIAFKAIDVVVAGFEETKSVWIISDQCEEIGEAMLHRLGRGVTYLHGEGAFSGDSKKVLFSVISRLEEAKLKMIVEDIDPDAFLAIAPIAEVRGGRFKKRSIH
jgi:uncharacterized membrane-anchored protein YitT (DUF2179 family)